jgi:hypothetical protein
MDLMRKGFINKLPPIRDRIFSKRNNLDCKKGTGKNSEELAPER